MVLNVSMNLSIDRDITWKLNGIPHIDGNKHLIKFYNLIEVLQSVYEKTLGEIHLTRLTTAL